MYVPDFSLLDQNGQLFEWSKYVGRYRMVLYFYPKDHTPGCTQQACQYRTYYPTWAKEEVLVVGISGDSVEKHFQFSADYQLPFRLLSDAGNQLRKAWEVPRQLLGVLPGRVSYLVEKDGRIAHIINAVQPQKHVEATRDWVEGRL